MFWQKYFPDSFSRSSDRDQTFNRKRKLPVKTKLLFALGAGTEGMVTAAGITTVLFLIIYLLMKFEYLNLRYIII